MHENVSTLSRPLIYVFQHARNIDAMRNTVAIYAIVRVYNREQKRSRDEHGGKRGRKREKHRGLEVV